MELKIIKRNNNSKVKCNINRLRHYNSQTSNTRWPHRTIKSLKHQRHCLLLMSQWQTIPLVQWADLPLILLKQRTQRTITMHPNSNKNKRSSKLHLIWFLATHRIIISFNNSNHLQETTTIITFLHISQCLHSNNNRQSKSILWHHLTNIKDPLHRRVLLHTRHQLELHIRHQIQVHILLTHMESTISKSQMGLFPQVIRNLNSQDQVLH